MHAPSLFVLLGAGGLILLLLIVFWIEYRRRARWPWRDAPPSWGGLYRYSLAQQVARRKRIPRSHRGDLLARAQAERRRIYLLERDQPDDYD